MGKVFLHNLSFGDRVHERTQRHDFDKRAQLCADDGDIVVTRSPYDGALREYLCKIGCIRRDVQCITPQNTSQSDAYSIFRDESVKQATKAAMRASPSSAWVLDSFVLSEWEAQWARQLGIITPMDPSLYERFDNRVNFRGLAQEVGLVIPEGRDRARSRLSVGAAAFKLFAAGFEEVLIKQEQGNMGAGISVVTPRTLPHYLVYMHKGAASLIEGRYAIQMSPSILFEIRDYGDVRHVATHVQILKDFTCVGVRSDAWLPRDLRDRILEPATKFIERLAGEGVRGYVAMDAIVTSGGRVLWVDANITRTHTYYAYQVARRATGASQMPAYRSGRVRHSHWKDIGIDGVLHELDPILFSPGARSGIIPYDDRFLRDRGTLDYVVVGSSPAEVEWICNAVHSGNHRVLSAATSV